MKEFFFNIVDEGHTPKIDHDPATLHCSQWLDLGCHGYYSVLQKLNVPFVQIDNWVIIVTKPTYLHYFSLFQIFLEVAPFSLSCELRRTPASQGQT